MTKAETAKLIAIIVASYPQSDKYNSAEQIEAVVNAWSTMFEDDNSKLVALAVKKHVATNKWPPSIAEIRKIMAEIEHPELLPPDKAWAYVADVLNVMQNEHFTGIRSNKDEAPPLITETVTALGGWSKLLEKHRGVYCGHSKPDQDKDEFFYQYRPSYERELEKAMLPQKTREMIFKEADQLGGKTIAAIDNARRKREDSEKWAVIRFGIISNALEDHNEKESES